VQPRQYIQRCPHTDRNILLSTKSGVFQEPNFHEKNPFEVRSLLTRKALLNAGSLLGFTRYNAQNGKTVQIFLEKLFDYRYCGLKSSARIYHAHEIRSGWDVSIPINGKIMLFACQ
jgi:hypothetical protein